MLTFPSEPHHVWHPRRKLLVWPRRAPKIDFLRLSPNLKSQLTQPTRGARSAQSRLASPRSESQLTAFFQIPKVLSASGHDGIHVPGPISYLGFLLWHLWLSHPPRTRVSTYAQCMHLTNPCTKRKVLSLTQPKGKIYKTKYDNIKKNLRNYITACPFYKYLIILQGGSLRYLCLWWNFCSRACFREVFSFFLGTLFHFFFFLSFLLVSSYSLPTFQSTCNFLTLQAFRYFPDLIVLFIVSFFPLFIISMTHCLIPFLYPVCIFLLFTSRFPLSFFRFWHINIIEMHNVVYIYIHTFSCDFVNL